MGFGNVLYNNRQRQGKFVHGEKVTPHSRACRDVREGKREEGCNAKVQRRGEEQEKGLVVTWRGMGILPMAFHD
jgi:hypothetical protein